MDAPITSPQKSTDIIRRWLYPLVLLFIYATWFIYMLLANRWHLFQEFWSVSLTMAFGSFVAGATAAGGSTVAFPVFTKVLQIETADARTFGLMIQAVGMTVAALMILVQRIKILPRVILWASLGGILGQIWGTYAIIIPSPYPKILFTFAATAFGLALAIARWWLNWLPRPDLPSWDQPQRFHFLVIGILGGIFAGNTGAGIDMLTFIVLTLAYGIHEKISTPTTVIIMGLNSIVGFFLHGVVSQDIGIAWRYWLVSIPIVIIGAPLGAIVCSRIKRDHLIIFLLSLISLEFITTIWLVPFNTSAILVTMMAVAICALWFLLMLRSRQQRLTIE